MNEENRVCEEKIKDIYDAFNCFKQRFLIGKKSIFRLNNDDEILNENSIKYLMDNFVNNGYNGKDSFIDKIKSQLIEEPKKSENDKKNAIEVLAHIIWLWRLVPSNAVRDSTIKSVQEVLNLDEDFKNISSGLDKNPFFKNDIKGIAKTGTYYNTNKPFEIAYVIKMLNDVKNDKFIEFLSKSDGMVTIKGNNLINDKKVKYDNTKKEGVEKSASIFHALLHFFKPDKYEAIISNTHKELIVKEFENKVELDEKTKFKPEIDWKIHCIRKKLEENNEKYKDEINLFYQTEIQEQWNPSILPAKNIIYYGAPGTGKTYDILKLVKAKVKSQCDDDKDLEKYYKVIQFHPSYSYEDFIDGIKPVKSKNDNSIINLELVDGVFKKMCQDAYQELCCAKDEEREPNKFYFIADEINRAELSRVFGELLLCIEEDKRLRFDKNGVLNGVYITTQNSTLWEEKNAVLKIGEELYFGVPENIYFLATMNDIDKSIDSFDLALRRRFKWVYKGCDYDVIYNYLLEKGVNEEDLSLYVSDDKSQKGRCNLLNEYIRETLNLGESYELGHSYFMNIKVHNGKIPKNAYENLFDLELAPLLSEYLRSEISNPKDLKAKLSYMKKIFTTGQECK